MEEQLGLIKDIKFGVRDTNTACLFFTIEVLGGQTLWLILGAQNICDFITKSQCYELRHLEGKPCVASVGDGQIKFLRMLDWPREVKQ